MLNLLRAGGDAEITELKRWLIQIFNYETATDPGHTITEWVDCYGGWVRTLIIERPNSHINDQIAESCLNF